MGKSSREKSSGGSKGPVRKGGETLETMKGVARASAKSGEFAPIGDVTLQSTSASVSNRIEICKQTGCNDISTTTGYCRFHYLASWRKLKGKEARKKGQELEVYLKDLSRKFPEDFLEKLRADVEDLSEKEATAEPEERGTLFDSIEGDEDIETIISGLKVEDF